MNVRYAELKDEIKEEWEDHIAAELNVTREELTDDMRRSKKSGRMKFTNARLRERLEKESDEIKAIVAEEKGLADGKVIEPSKLKEM